MTPFWVLQTTNAPASVCLNGDELVLENRYIRRVIDIQRGTTVSLTDGDGTEILAETIREGEISVDGTVYPIEGPCEIRIREGNLTEKKFDYVPKSYNTHPFPYPAPGKTAELIYQRGTLEIRLVYEIFDDMPAMRKSLYVRNNGDCTVTIDTAETEALSLTDDGVLRYYLRRQYGLHAL